jgi:tetratricopeptide (TPR) repeat protein
VHAVNVAASLGNSPELAEAWAKRACMHAMRTEFDNAFNAANEAAAVADRLDVPYQTQDRKSRSTAMANLYRGVVETYKGRWQLGSDYSQRAATQFRQCGDMLELAMAHAMVSENLYFHGRLDEALSWAKSGLEIIERSGAKQGILELQVSCVTVLARLGDIEAMTAMLERLRRLTSETDGLQKAAADSLSARYAMAAGECHHITGNIDEAALNLEGGTRFADRYSFIGTRPRVVMCYPLLAQTLLKQRQRVESGGPGRRIASRRKVRRLISIAYKWANSFPSLMAPTLLADGMYLWRFGDTAKASEKLEESIRVAEQQEAPLIRKDCEREAQILREGLVREV